MSHVHSTEVCTFIMIQAFIITCCGDQLTLDEGSSCKQRHTLTVFWHSLKSKQVQSCDCFKWMLMFNQFSASTHIIAAQCCYQHWTRQHECNKCSESWPTHVTRSVDCSCKDIVNHLLICSTIFSWPTDGHWSDPWLTNSTKHSNKMIEITEW